MEKPAYAGIQSLINSGDRIHQSIVELEGSLKKAFVGEGDSETKIREEGDSGTFGSKGRW